MMRQGGLGAGAGVVAKMLATIMATMLAGCFGLALMMGCSSNPPPRPLPGPKPTPIPGPGLPAAAEQPASAASAAPARPEQAKAEAPAGPPTWYRQGVFDLAGHEHRAFAVTAGDVREARREAMRLGYEAYPAGSVAAHEALRLDDGRWTFYVLMASGG